MQSTALPVADSAQPRWGVRAILMGIAIYLGLLLVVFGSAGIVARLIVIPPDVRPYLNAAALVVGEALMLAPVGIMAVVVARGSWSAVGFRRFDVMLGCTLPMTYLLLAFCGSALWGLVLHAQGWDTQADIVSGFKDNPILVALALIAVGVAAPIAEEAFFRGFLIGGLRDRVGNVGALLISAAIFTLPHLPVSIYPAIFGLGLLLGLLFLQTGSLWPGVLMHAAFNTIGFVAQFAVSR